MNRVALHKEDYRALAELRHQIRRFLHFSEQAARVAGLRLAQYQFLLAVKGLPEGHKPTIRTLSERLRLKHHSVVGLVDRLARRDLVLRRRSEADRREILVDLTPRGERLLAGLALVHWEELRTRGPALAAALAGLSERHRSRRTRRG